MKKRQELTSPERLAKMSLTAFIEELFSVLCETVKTGGSARLEDCMAEDKRRDKKAYEKAVIKMNQAFGVRITAPGVLDTRDVAD